MIYGSLWIGFLSGLALVFKSYNACIAAASDIQAAQVVGAVVLVYLIV